MKNSLKFLCATLASTLYIVPLTSSALVVFYFDEAAWGAAVENVETLVTDAAGVATANEVASSPSQNQTLGGLLTFDAANTGLSRSFTLATLESGAGFTFSDGEASPASAGYENALSVGDINNFENDDWELALTAGPDAFAFAFDLRDNGDLGNPEDTISVFDSSGGLLDSTDAVPTSTGGGTFFGFVSDTPFARVVYDDDAGGDDIAIANFQFAVVPEPSHFSLVLGLLALAFPLVRRSLAT